MKTKDEDNLPPLSVQKTKKDKKGGLLSSFKLIKIDRFLCLSVLNKKFKGSLRDPSLCFLSSLFKKREPKSRKKLFSLYLRAVIAILFVLLGSGLIIKPSLDKTGFSLVEVAKISAESEKNDLFVSSQNNFLPESPEFLLVENSTLKASSPPINFSSQALGVIVPSYEPKETGRTAVLEHTVVSGETFSLLALKYEISENTILWANNLTKNSTLKIGQKLIILPTSGTIHHVKSGDTISEIARIYKGKTSEIIDFNQLSGEADIFVGDIIIVPNGTMPPPSVQEAPTSSNVPLASSYFIAPVSSPYIITQGLHWYNAIDLSHKGGACGRPVFAAAGGIVQRTGYDRTAGNYIRILHPNGVITFYGHLSSILVSAGQTVSQGMRIGSIGNTGYTIGQTGCHLHFEVRGAKNPFAR